MSVLGIDIGAGTSKSAVFTSDGRSTAAAEEPTARSYPELIAQVLGIVARLGKAHAVEAIGVGVPGFISLPERVIVRSPNMRFLDGTALEKDLAAAIGLPVVVENDANAAALGEFRSLDEPRPQSFVHLTLGSGIGSGIVLEGRVYRGARGFAAEMGHLPVHAPGRPCGCGSHGCAETESSEAGIVASYREYSGDPSPIRSQEVFKRLQQGEEAARRAFQRAGSYLGVLFAQIVCVLDPERISIGGGVAAAGDALLAPAREELGRRLGASGRGGTRIEPARLGNGAGAAGAAALAADLLPRRGGAVRPRHSGAVRPPSPMGPGRRGPSGP